MPLLIINLLQIMSHISFTYHFIWRTKYREDTISEEYERNLYGYIFSMCRNKDCYLYRLNSMPNHIHMCCEVKQTIAVSEFIKVIKQETSKWMKEHPKWFPEFTAWGKGYAGFTYSAQDRPKIIEYIKNQKIHHKEVSFKDEYLNLLREFGLDPKDDNFFYEDDEDMSLE